MEHQEHHQGNKEEQKTVTDHIRQWLTPLLILVIGWLLSDKMGNIAEKLKVIETLQITITQIRSETDAFKRDLQRLEKENDERKKEIDDLNKFHADGIYKAAERNLRRSIK